jgi:hypothetical protein
MIPEPHAQLKQQNATKAPSGPIGRILPGSHFDLKTSKVVQAGDLREASKNNKPELARSHDRSENASLAAGKGENAKSGNDLQQKDMDSKDSHGDWVCVSTSEAPPQISATVPPTAAPAPPVLSLPSLKQKDSEEASRRCRALISSFKHFATAC